MIESFEATLGPMRQRLLEHPIFTHIQTVGEMQSFMQSHIFAVWDFMSLLKTLQRQLTCVDVPWTPPRRRDAARFINEIVLGEESDQIAPGQYLSHFELYHEAMCDAGADTTCMDRFLEVLSSGEGYAQALQISEAPAHVQAFVHTTMNFCALKSHEVAAAFLYGREDVIPAMFTRILSASTPSADPRFAKLKLYLERHIEVDAGDHGPMARRLIQALCGRDEEKWKEAALVANAALLARIHLWDGIMADLQPCRERAVEA